MTSKDQIAEQKSCALRTFAAVKDADDHPFHDTVCQLRLKEPCRRSPGNRISRETERQPLLPDLHHRKPERQFHRKNTQPSFHAIHVTLHPIFVGTPRALLIRHADLTLIFGR
jgi:hypothetical protein